MNLSSEPESNVEPQEVREDHGSSVPPIRFRVFPTAILASILVIFVGLLILVHFSTPKLEGVQRPELALEMVANQMMYLRQGLAGTPEWEQTFNEVVGGTDQEIDQLIEWYAELAENSSDPLVHLYLAVLQVEGGYLELVKDKLSEWQNRPIPYPFFATLLGVAFFNEPVTGSDALELQARLAEMVPDSTVGFIIN